jgi:bifunctional DNA-binding transcriptional regulator/antitoxin component of YhaV-PrlF toxin-antitoxin module
MPKACYNVSIDYATQEQDMNDKEFTLEIAKDGTLTIPAEVTQALGLSPRQSVTIEARERELLLRASRGERLERIGDLLRFALTGVAWSDIEAARQERCVSE